MSYVLRRFAFYLLAAWASITLNFVIVRLAPGDPATTLLARFRGELRPEAVQALRAAFGLTDEPMILQYATYVSHLLRGDLGISIAFFPTPVADVMGEALLWTLWLAGTAVIVSFVLGSVLGIVAAWRRGGWLDSVLPPALALLGAFPYFWLAMLLLFVFGFALGWFPLRHAYDDLLQPALRAAFVRSVLEHAVLPAGAVVLASLGGWMLAMRNTMIGVLGEDYVTLARAKGLSERRVIFNYAARNALLPNVTSFGMALGFVLSGSLLTEVVFSYPGLGYLLVLAVRNQDYPLMQGLFLSITLGVLGANWLVDLLYSRLDPRARSTG